MTKELAMGLIEDLTEPPVPAAKPATTDTAPPSNATGPASEPSPAAADDREEEKAHTDWPVG